MSRKPKQMLNDRTAVRDAEAFIVEYLRSVDNGLVHTLYDCSHSRAYRNVVATRNGQRGA